MEKARINHNTAFPTVSVVIPVKNEGKKIRKCIEGILSQSVPVLEIIVIDSGSEDDTCQILREYDIVKLIEILPSEFGHGKTRNLGVQHAQGEYVLLTVGDAWAFNEDWISELLNGFVDDEVAGVCGQQVVPHDLDKNPMEWFSPQSKPKIKRVQYPKKSDWEKASPTEKKAACGWDDVTAMYRKTALEAIPFQEVSYCEDAVWAKEALMAGHALAYNFAARVYHYHTENSDFIFKRTFTVAFFRYQHFGYKTKPHEAGFGWHLKVIKTLFQRLQFNLPQIMRWYQYNRNNFKAFRKALRTFNEKIEQGNEALEQAHLQYCGKPPIPVKE